MSDRKVVKAIADALDATMAAVAFTNVLLSQLPDSAGHSLLKESNAALKRAEMHLQQIAFWRAPTNERPAQPPPVPERIIDQSLSGPDYKLIGGKR